MNTIHIPLREGLSALGGASIIVASVVWAGGLPGWMFLAGFLVAFACVLTLLVAIGLGPVGRFLVAVDGGLKGIPNSQTDRHSDIHTPEPADPIRDQVIAALVSLGAKPAKARAAVQASSEGPRDLKSWLGRAVRYAA